MIEAQITKAVVKYDKGQLYLLGVAQYDDTMVNFKIRYNATNIDDETKEELRQNLAEAFDIPAYRVDLKWELLEKKMRLGLFEAHLKGLQ